MGLLVYCVGGNVTSWLLVGVCLFADLLFVFVCAAFFFVVLLRF